MREARPGQRPGRQVAQEWPFTRYCTLQAFALHLDPKANVPISWEQTLRPTPLGTTPCWPLGCVTTFPWLQANIAAAGGRRGRLWGPHPPSLSGGPGFRRSHSSAPVGVLVAMPTSPRWTSEAG